MMEENKMHSNMCNCGEDNMMGHIGRKNRHKLLKFVVVMIFMFMSFYIGVQFGEIKGVLGASRYGKIHNPMMGNQMMYGNGQQMPQGMMMQQY